MSRFYPLRRWVAGTYKRECDICGEDELRYRMFTNEEKAIVCADCFDEVDNRHSIHRQPVGKLEKPFRRD